MSDEENESVYAEVQEEVEIKGDKMTKNKASQPNELAKNRHRRSYTVGQSRHKFCIRWGLEFPWLKPSRTNESIGYCTICRRDLVCKKSHLERHQKTFKHMRLQGFENVYTVNEPEVDLIEAHTSGYLDNDYDYEDEVALDDDNFEYTTIKVEPAKISPSTTIARSKQKLSSKKQIKADKSPTTSLTSSPKIKRESSLASTPLHQHQPADERERPPREISDFYYIPRPPTKDSFDLFFESISATVKALPPKLAAEVKSRVSQLIAEFELRAICEKEAEEKAAASQQSITALSPQVGSVVAVDQTICSSSSSEVPPPRVQEGQPITYVYSYQSK